MTKMAKIVAVVVVVAGLMVGQSALLAAPAHKSALTAERTANFGFFTQVLRFLGFDPGTIDTRPAPVNGNDGDRTQPGDSTPKMSQPGTGITPDGAIWGGGNRCRYGCTP